MVFASVVLEIGLAVLAMLVTATLVIVGPRQLVRAVRDFRWRLEGIALPTTVLLGVLFLRWATQDVAQTISTQVTGVAITDYLFGIDRALFGETPVVFLQSIQMDELTSYFVFVYIYGYAFLLAFPFVAYFALREMDELSTLILAYTANYGIGLLCYFVFIAYGPRNVDPTLFEGLLYTAFPESGFLTHSINHNTNVFPSLHTSMAMTVFFLAVHTREKYPLWVPLSGVLAVSVALSTMYLGIHWFSDVIAGTLLALVSVYIGRNYTVEGLVRTARAFFSTKFKDARTRFEGDRE
ncbi:phosphatase PAP2 family protein [Halostagnicola bangensis]